MDENKIILLLALVGGTIGFVADIFLSMSLGWGFSFFRCFGMSLLGSGLFYFAAHSALKPSRSTKKDDDRVEQVVGFEKSVEDCYESIVVEQETY